MADMYAAQQEHGESDACPGGIVPIPAPNCTSLQYVILLTTGVTCVALLLDLAKRYLFSRNTTDNSTLTDEELIVKGSYSDGLKAGYEGKKWGRGESYTMATDAQLTSSAGGHDAKSNYDDYDAVDSQYPVHSRPLHTQTILEGDEEATETSKDDGQKPQVGKELGHVLDDLIGALRTTIHSSSSTEGLPDNCKDNVAKLASLESLFVSLGREVDDKVINLVAESSSDGIENQSLDTLSKVENESAAYKQCWLGLRRLLFCVDIHLRNSTHYQVFHHECERLQTAIDKYSEQVKSENQNEDVSKMSNQDLVDSVKELEKVNSMLKMWGETIARLCDQSKSVYPIHMRTEELSDQVATKALCGYHTDKTTVKEGDIMLLLDNSNSEKWKLSTTSGEEIELPAVCCVIPPPDLNTMKMVGRVETSFKELSKYIQQKNSDRLNLFAKRLILLIASKDFKSITKEQRDDLLTQMAFLEVFLRKFDKDGQHKDIFDKFAELRTIVSNLEQNGTDSGMSELLDLFSSWQKIATVYENSAYDKEKRKLLVKQGIILDSEDTEWETLAEIEEARRELGLAVSVQRETMAVGEATKYETATGETRQTFSITGVIDPRDDTELSMAEAINKGIIDQTEGIYKNLKTGESYPIPVAMNAGLIIVSSTKTTKARELKKAIGVITVEFTRENRPYKITHAIDPVSHDQIAISDAVDLGIFDPDRQTYKNTESGEEMSVENAIDSSFLVVEYDTEAEASQPEVTKKTFVVSSALDRKTGKHYKFEEAVDHGLIDKDAGMYLDTVSGQKINIVEAIKRKLMKGRVVSHPDKIDAAFLSRQRSGSVDSQGSESSKLSELE